jgi:hypothetical protein
MPLRFSRATLAVLALSGSSLRAATPQEDIEQIKEMIRKTAFGQNLLETTKNIPIVITSGITPNYIARYVDDRKLVELAPKAYSKKSFYLETVLLHELTHAQAALPFETFEDEQRAYQSELVYSVQKALVNNEFSRKLGKYYLERHKFEERRVRLSQSNVGIEAWGAYSLDLEKFKARVPSDISSIVDNLVLFETDPGDFYWNIEQMYRSSPHHVSFTELEDFTKLMGSNRLKEIDKNRFSYRFGAYYLINGKRYRWAVVEHAIDADRLGGVKVLREKLGTFESTGVDELKAQILKWRENLFMKSTTSPAEHGRK